MKENLNGYGKIGTLLIKNRRILFLFIVVSIVPLLFVYLFGPINSWQNVKVYSLMNIIDGPYPREMRAGQSAADRKNLPYKSNVLLIYVYTNSHEQSYGNLKYFIENAVKEKDGVDYFFILQQVKNTIINETELPALPFSNAFYIQHENKCFDYGTIGWFLDAYTVYLPYKKANHIHIRQLSTRINEKVPLDDYEYFIFMNDSVRGPFFPPYFLQFLQAHQNSSRERFFWHHIFTRRLNDKIKLFGSTISCLNGPHVESFLVATDFVGLSSMLKPEEQSPSYQVGFLGCYESRSDAQLISELGMSRRIIEAGYGIGSLLQKYQIVDFSKGSNFTCTIGGNPFADKVMDGISIEPYEVVFVKYMTNEVSSLAHERAKTYEKWMEANKKLFQKS